ncbi:MAG: hypothetical protein JW395_2950 [Nitrospira sp.]|nr:hypothetical protein [Nitrospira sp.]
MKRFFAETPPVETIAPADDVAEVVEERRKSPVDPTNRARSVPPVEKPSDDAEAKKSPQFAPTAKQG